LSYHYNYAGAVPRILRWKYKTEFASGASEKKFLYPPLFQMWGTSKQISVGANLLSGCRIKVTL